MSLSMVSLSLSNHLGFMSGGKERERLIHFYVCGWISFFFFFFGQFVVGLVALHLMTTAVRQIYGELMGILLEVYVELQFQLS